MCGEGLPWLPRVHKGGCSHSSWGWSPMSGEVWLPQSGVMLREVSLWSGWRGRQGRCESTSAKNNWDEHKCWRDPWLR